MTFPPLLPRQRCVATLLIGLAVVPAASADSVDRYIARQMELQHIPGLSLAVIRHGRIIKMRGYGSADLEHSVPATPHTVYEIGSITKQFTAMAVLLLAEQERLALTDPIGKHLPSLPDSWKAVTVRQLLTHTAGVPDYETIMGYDAYRNPMTPDAVIALAAPKGLDFAPGAKWNYSNTGYYLLTLLIEKVSGAPYDQFVSQHLLMPAGMTVTRSSDPSVLIPHRAAGYEYKEGRLRNRDPIQPSATGGAGMLVSTVGDMAKWDAFVRRRSVLRSESYEQMWSEARLTEGGPTGYGLAWFIDRVNGHRTLGHSGGTAGFTAQFLQLPEDALSVIVLTNAANGNPDSIATRIAAIHLPTLVYRAIPDPQPAIAELLRDYFTHRTDEQPYRAALSERFASELAPNWGTNLPFYRSLGAPLAIELVERVANDRLRYRVRYRELTRLVLVKLSADGRIDGMEIRDD